MIRVITVVAGGWSAAKVDMKKLPGWVIGVNDAGIRIECDVVLSMDRLWTENRWQQLKAREKPTWIRIAALKCIEERPPWLFVFDCDHKSPHFTMEPGWLNGTNSGLAALNLAYRQRPQIVYLVGFDMNLSPEGKAHWYPAYPWAAENPAKRAKLNGWAREFSHVEKAFRGIGTEVFNVSETSAIWQFRRMSPTDFARCSR